MKKFIINLIAINIILCTSAFANNIPCQMPHKHTIKERKEIDLILENRLNLTQEQKDYIKTNRQKHKKDIENLIEKMQKLHIDIRNVYLTGIPKWQADLRTAHLKAELAILKQNIDKMKTENRKNFENILNPDQKAEFEIIKKEFAAKKPCKHN